jgi:hypothetical protein
MNNIKKTISYLISIIVIFGTTTTCLAEESAYVWSPIEETAQTSSSSLESTENSNPLELESGSAILIEQTTRANIVRI